MGHAIGAVLISTIVARLDASVAASAAIPPQAKASITRMVAANAADLAFGEQRMFAREPVPLQRQLNAIRRTATTVAHHTNARLRPASSR